MAFRRQDIPKTTRKGEEGAPRRLYPRFIRDRSFLPKIELAIGYLDGMVGRKRADLSPDAVLELFGDPKLARCVLTCLADSYRYRTPELAEVIGEAAALALAGWDLLTAADLRAHVYAAVNAERGGFVEEGERAAFLAGVAGPLGLSGEQLGDLLHLDAERNAVLVRVGPRPAAEDVVARYNAMLVTSVLRHASSVTLELPGLDAIAVETVCGRHEVTWRRLGAETVRLAGKRNVVGSWVGFGARVARCAAQLIALCPAAPTGQATVHLGDQSLSFVVDAKVAAALRPKLRAVAGADGIIRGAALADEVAMRRRRTAGATNGWTLKRSFDPVVVEGAVVLPELVFTRGEVSVAVVPVPSGAGRTPALAALERVGAVRPVIALGVPGGLTKVPALAVPDAASLVALLDEIADGLVGSPTPRGVIHEELNRRGWVALERVGELFGEVGGAEQRLQPLLADGEAAFVAGFGLCRVGFLDELLDWLPDGPVDVAALRTEVVARVGDGAGADALTLHVLASRPLVAPSRAAPTAEPPRGWAA